MSKKIYIGIDNVAKPMKKIYIGVDGVARKIKKAYIGVDGIAKPFYIKCLYDETEHEWEEIDSSDPTCTEEGYVDYECSVCGETYTETIDALGHNMVEDEYYHIDPTCTEDGEEYWYCTRCSHTEDKIISALGHDYSTEDDDYGICRRCGESEVRYCDCGAEMIYDEELYGGWYCPDCGA